ncbi:hypothetical protein BATDEDRAFT_28058 [Batrachochytrium dendrobatidis JAM81]|uniref:Phospholipid scramblase n=2 Tax=Batrachochytrium dendrobatidis TaxID=109871 RepID=F4PCP9_BATDJ|nr:uncharacterized protein BATDEDRAFT_28058 [Batrachochytrium dendrobatidis JAM81]EGF76983.1 hypothetical protein BATDEDRAFT_28058 [Batrachochytrium dendrobatidis JAM81]KAK5672478.1 hypothetical protein QVD99_001238 [Batrachochytrium dendrobatidis]OAJ44963.1 hypothetical protein BDEG_28138 [Batrachochytrium dendrobatidis JEL423]|eukprot:XP_006682395.1 hypothetical protein BATDEDRAFT_28058 [Batrachochytrium dendrobatidis JAM81]
MQPEKIPNVSNTLVVIPTPTFTDILQLSTPAYSILACSTLVVDRELGLVNMMIGIEQENQYSIKDSVGNDIGSIVEKSFSVKDRIVKQILRTQSPFKADVLNSYGDVVLKIERPTKWLLNSTITVTECNGNLIGKVKQKWHLYRRRYELVQHKKPFAKINGKPWTRNFGIENESGGKLGLITRSFSGVIRELFTNIGVYSIYMDGTPDLARPLTLDERAIMLAAAICIDIDYFSQIIRIG